jgi:hypothetical protein
MTCEFLVDHITFLQLPRLAQAGPPQSYICRVVIETRGFLGPESNQSRWQFTFQWNQEGQSHVYQRMNGANHLNICRWIARLYLPASAHLPLHGTDFIFFPILVAGSFSLEVVANRQKSRWRHEKTRTLSFSGGV